jgi:hypothetical protein
MWRVSSASLAALVLLGGCASVDMAAPDLPTSPGAQPSVVFVNDPAGWPQDPFVFQQVRMAGDTLDISVQYGGGCAGHDFTLLLSPIVRESLPVQASAWLAHDAKGDPCRALIGRTLRFDLTPLKHLYRQNYGVQSGTIRLTIAGWPEPVSYGF